MKITFPQFLLILLTGLSACNLERPIEIILPAYESKLVVECYIEKGKPFQVALTESVSYLADPTLPIVSNAKVTIQKNGQLFNLPFFPFVDQENKRAYNYVSSTPVNFNTGDEFNIEVVDAAKNRKLTGTAKALAPPTITTLTATFRDSLAYLLIRFPDIDPVEKNYYRVIINRDSLTRNPETDFYFEGRFKTNNEISVTTTYRFKQEDTLIVSVYHIEEKYYDFLDTFGDAVRANGNPFAQPSSILNTVEGGVGVFTVLAFERRKFIVRKSGLVDLPL